MNDLNVAAEALQQTLLFGPSYGNAPDGVIDAQVSDLLLALGMHYSPNDLKIVGKMLLLIAVLAKRVAELERLLKEGSR